MGNGKVVFGLGIVAVAIAIPIILSRKKKAEGLIGDLNDDGKRSQEDIDILKQYILGFPISEISPLSDAEFLRRADVNGDGTINVIDTVALYHLFD